MAHQEGDVLLGRYQVIRPVKTGGMGAVYKACDLQFADRGALALKEMLSDFSDQDTRDLIKEKFTEEARTLVNLSHAGIPRVWDHFLQGDVHYIVMEFIEGDSLEQVLEESLTLARTPLAPQVVVGIAIQLCTILQYLHTRPQGAILHRDVKPANIILRRDSHEVVLVDFGLARTFDAASLSTKTTVGTLGYAPMEQLRGRPEPASDIYGVGATMYHLLTGKRPAPFERSKLSVALPGAPQVLTQLVDKALEEDPGNRFESVAEMRVALEYVLPALDASGPISYEGMVAPHQPPADTRAADAGPAETRAPQRAASPSESLLRAAHRVTESVPPRARLPVAAVTVLVAMVVLLGLGRLVFSRAPGAELFARAGKAAEWKITHLERGAFTREGLVVSGAEGGPSVGGLIMVPAATSLAATDLSFLVRRTGNPGFQVFVNDVGFESRDGTSAYEVMLQRIIRVDPVEILRGLSAAPLTAGPEVSTAPPKLLLPLLEDTRGAIERYHLQWDGSTLALAAGWYTPGVHVTQVQDGDATPTAAPATERQVEVPTTSPPSPVTRLMFVVTTRQKSDSICFSQLHVVSP